MKKKAEILGTRTKARLRMSTEGRDLVSTGEAAGDDPTVADIMKRDVVSVRPETTVKELAELMHERRVGGAPVVDGEGRLVGIVTDGDLIAEETDVHMPPSIDIFGAIVYLGSFHKYEERLRKAVGATVGDVMTTKVYTVHPDDDVRKAATLMRDHKIGRIPVVDEEDRLVGLVTRTDIVHSLGF
jgi:CBS domain-containing protein